MIELDLLPALVALADTGSLPAAGERLGITPPGVHRQVRVLAVTSRREWRHRVDGARSAVDPTEATMSSLALSLLAAPSASAQNVLVSTQNELRLFTSAGALLRTEPVPYPTGVRPGRESTRDVVAVGRTALVYNGTFDPWLSALDSATGAWRHVNSLGWSTASSTGYGGIAILQPWVFATDMDTCCGLDTHSGIVRFDGQYATSTRFADGTDYIDVNTGVGEVYALRSDGVSVDVFDPASMLLDRTITLSMAFQAVAVDDDGSMYVVNRNGIVYAYDGNGALMWSGGNGAMSLLDVDVSHTSDLIVMGDEFGWVTVFIGPTGTIVSDFDASVSEAYVAFVE